jgi:hypothetical protein
VDELPQFLSCERIDLSAFAGKNSIRENGQEDTGLLMIDEILSRDESGVSFEKGTFLM